MDTKKLRQFSLDKQMQTRDLQRHEQVLTATHGVSNTVIDATAALINYLEGHTSKTEITNHLESIGTPDALKIIPAIESLHDTIKTHQNTDLSEVTAVMRDILNEAKQIPKELPEHKEQKLHDYSPQLQSLESAINSIQEAVKAQKLVAEAPIVNVPETKVEIAAPDLTPLQSSLKDVVSAVQEIVIPEYKTDNKAVEALLKKTNTFLKQLLEKPVSEGGGGGSSWVALGSNGYPAPLKIDGTGALVTSGGSTTEYKTLFDFASDGTYIYKGKAVPGTATSTALWQIQKIVFDASGNPTGKLFADGDASFVKRWDQRLTFGYTV
jgi:hypothetical protein